MTDFLTKLFVKNHTHTTDVFVRKAYGKLAGCVGICCNGILSLLKIVSGLLFHCVSLVADGVNNLSDMGNAIITVIGFRLAAKPADKDHPFGHARYEYITGLLVSFLILMLGFSLLKTAVESIFFPRETIFHAVAIISMAISIAIKLWMFTFYRKIGKKIDSVALLASAQDSLNDVYSTSGVLICFLLGKYFHLPLDGYVGVAVSLLVLYSGWELINQTLSPLLGEAPNEELVKEIETEILSFHESIIGIHDLMVHQYGAGSFFASVHVEFPASQSFTMSHEIVDQIEIHFQKEHHLQLVIHMDPVETDNPCVNQLREMVGNILRGISPTLSMHDFRVVFLESHKNLIFDVVVPFDFPYSIPDLHQRIQDKAGENNHCLIRFDRQYANKE